MSVSGTIPTYDTLDGTLPVGGTTGQVVTKLSATDYDANWQTPVPGLTLPLGQNLTFAPDNTYDIGASGANRPRNLFLAGNETVAGTSTIGTLNTALLAPAGNVVEQRNGANAQQLLLYNTYTDASNYERLRISALGTSYLIGTAQLGTGVVRDIAVAAGGNLFLRAGGVTGWQVASVGGHFGAESDNGRDIGQPATLRPRTIYAGTSVVTPVVSAGAGTALLPSISFAGDPNTGFWNPAADWVGVTTAGVARWVVDSNGTLFPWTDNTTDIGSATNHIRNVVAAGSVTGTGGIIGPFLWNQSGGLRLVPTGGNVQAEGSLVLSPDNTLDIGTAGALRPRTIYAGTSVVIAGKAVAADPAAGNGLAWNTNGFYATMVPGPQGPKGDTGATGVQGPQGIQGLPGPVTNWRGNFSGITQYNQWDAVTLNGSSYLAPVSIPLGTIPPAAPWVLMAQKGDVGATGAQGPQGVQGTTGAQGPKGDQGNPGIQGPQGPIGVTGTTGADGPQGVQGNPGPQGIAGPVGAPGAAGSAGAQGIQGPAGPSGPQGPAGLGLNVKGTVPTYTMLPAQPQPANDAYTVIDTGHLFTSNGTQWVDTGLVRGPAGPAGVDGAQGPTGATGSQGTKGDTGAQGVQGPPGTQGPMGPQGNPGDPFGTPTLAIGVVVHWRPPRNTHDRYGLCKPAVVTEVSNLALGLINAVVLGSQGSPVLLYDLIPEGVVEGQWHFAANCPYAMGLTSTLTRAFATLVGAGT